MKPTHLIKKKKKKSFSFPEDGAVELVINCNKPLALVIYDAPNTL